jgi:hypothetical protein
VVGVTVIVPVTGIHVTVRGLSTPRLIVLMRVGVPPKHDFLDHEENAQAQHERGANAVGACGSNTLHRLRQKREQCGTEQRPGSKAHEMGQETRAGALGKQQESTREGGAGDAAERCEHYDPTEEGHLPFLYACSTPIRSS